METFALLHPGIVTNCRARENGPIQNISPYNAAQKRHAGRRSDVGPDVVYRALLDATFCAAGR